MPAQSKSGANRRSTKACARCRRKKIKCDFSYPTCEACSNAHSECVGYNAQGGVEGPRSIVAHLEQQIAAQEIELEALKLIRQPLSKLQLFHNTTDVLATRLAATIADPSTSDTLKDAEIENNVPLISPIFLCQGPIPALGDRNLDEARTEPSHQNTKISLVPRHVIDIMLRNYCKIYLPQYPAVEEEQLYASCDRIFNDDNPTDYDHFTVAITLAISAQTLIRYDEQRALTSASDFWATAVDHLRYVGKIPWQRLQALLLLTHYGLLNPKFVNCSSCAAAATRFCLQLGLHRELPPSEKERLPAKFLNRRRRLFWVSYSTDCAVHSALRRSYVWPTSAISAEFPTSETQALDGAQTSITSTTSHMWLFRKIEAEVSSRMYHPNLTSWQHESKNDFEKWFIGIHDRLDAWYQEVLNDHNLADKIEFYEIHYRTQILKLNRPSPSLPKPTRSMRRKAIKSALILINEVSTIQRQGKLFYIWHFGHYLVEFGLSLLESIAAGLMEADSITNHLHGLDPSYLSNTIISLPYLLRQIARRWPTLYTSATVLENYSTSILNSFRAWGNESLASVFNSSVHEQLSQHLLGSTFGKGKEDVSCHCSNQPSTEIPTVNKLDLQRLHNVSSNYLTGTIASLSNEQPLPGIQTDTLALDTHDSYLQSTRVESFSIEPDWSLDGLQHFQGTSYIGLNTDPVVEAESSSILPWEFSNLSYDEVFAALLEGRDVF